jgi:hypothetical protein
MSPSFLLFVHLATKSSLLKRHLIITRKILDELETFWRPLDVMTNLLGISIHTYMCTWVCRSQSLYISKCLNMYECIDVALRRHLILKAKKCFLNVVLIV